VLATSNRLASTGRVELTGLLEESSALFGVLAEIEALRLELLELREIPTGPKSP
jgi:hypothetical protein